MVCALMMLALAEYSFGQLLGIANCVRIHAQVLVFPEQNPRKRAQNLQTFRPRRCVLPEADVNRTIGVRNSLFFSDEQLSVIIFKLVRRTQTIIEMCLNYSVYDITHVKFRRNLSSSIQNMFR